MPQGKGTYGSQVGRPPKKKKNQEGGSVVVAEVKNDPFSAKNSEGIMVEKALEAIKEQNAISTEEDVQEQRLGDLPTTNAQERSQASPMGEEVGTGMYAMGGMVGKVRMKKDVAKFSEKLKKSQKEYKKKTRFEKGLKAAGAAVGALESPLAKKFRQEGSKKISQELGKMAGKSGAGKAKRKKK